MQRLIKFRAWEYAHERTKGIGWVDSPMVWKMNYEPEIWGSETISEGDRVELNKALERGGDADDRYELPHKSIYMQYTGLKDKNGVEIYEGDILRIGSSLIEEVKWVGAGDWVGAKQPMVGFISHETIYRKPIEVIGNIYENPELLETTNDQL